MNKVRSIFESMQKQKGDKLNILTFDTHERYQTQLCKTGHNFYSFTSEDSKEWDESYAKRPENYYRFPKGAIVTGVNFDFILSQSKFGQFQLTDTINKTLQIPVVSLEHTLPIDNWPESQLNGFRSMVGDVNVFISEYSANKWNMDCDNKVIHHSVDTELFKPSNSDENGKVLSVVNDFVNRDYCCNYSGWQRITEGLPIRLVGNTPGLSEPAKDINELVSEYQQAPVFLNTSTVSPVPTSLLEAMSCGCAVVSTATCMIPEIIKNGYNGFISNDEQVLARYIKELMGDKEMRENMGKNARKTILKDFSEDKFIKSWNEIFELAHRMKK